MRPNFQTVRLVAGHHTDPGSGVCVMELASMLAGEPFSDRPECVSGTLGALLRGYNDGLDDARRQALVYYASESIGTARGRSAERARRRLVRAWLADDRGTRGPLAAIGRRIAVTDPLGVSLHIAQRVRRENDDALHARVLALFDAVIAVARSAPPMMAVADCEPVGDDRDESRLAAR
jgi:hypothetical protein